MMRLCCCRCIAMISVFMWTTRRISSFYLAPFSSRSSSSRLASPPYQYSRRRRCLTAVTPRSISGDVKEIITIKTTKQQEVTPSEKRRRRAREKRMKLIGLAKAVDRGQKGIVSYRPAGADGTSWKALSGLPENKNKNKPFTVLGIESSCDDTGAAVVRSDGLILGEALAGQQDIHEEWGGVVPGLARDAHMEAIDRVVDQALAEAGLQSADQVDAIGVTVGPGLEICLRVGCTKAVALAEKYQKPFVAIHHLEAHILMARLPNQKMLEPIMTTDNDVSPQQQQHRAIEFPFLALLVSGGHCQLLHCKSMGNYKILGGTLDDSLGEAFDKTARLLGLPVGGGGGPALEKLALLGNPKAHPFSIPLRNRKDCDFSYAGLKSNVRRAAEALATERCVETPDQLPDQDKADIAASFQHVAIRHIEMRLKYAIEMIKNNADCDDDHAQRCAEGVVSPISTLAVVGGVAANKELRTRLRAVCDDAGWEMQVPPPRLCTDQGAMAAWAAVERIMMNSSDDPSNQQVHARFPFATMYEADDDVDPS